MGTAITNKTAIQAAQRPPHISIHTAERNLAARVAPAESLAAREDVAITYGTLTGGRGGGGTGGQRSRWGKG